MASTWNPSKALQHFSSANLNTVGGHSPIIGEFPDNAGVPGTIYNGVLKVGGQAVAKFPGMAVKIVDGTSFNSNGVDYFTRGGGSTYGANTFDQAFEGEDVWGFVHFDRKKPYVLASALKSTYRMLDVVGAGGRIYLQAYTDIKPGDKLEIVDALDSNGNVVTAVQPLANGKQIGTALSYAAANEPVYVIVGKLI
jgi:hypothetical protein